MLNGKHTLRACSLVLSFLAALWAQDYRATITGQVTDPSGSVIPRATIRLTSAATGQTKEVLTNQDGNYSLPYLDPGNYTLEATASGFQTARRTNISLRVAQSLSLPITMQVGEMSQQITVEAQTNQVDTVSADRGGSPLIP
jgi:Carboxypeptidase regulatory-like domain